MLRTELEDYLNLFFNIRVFKDACPNGLQVEGRAPIHKVATAVSADLITLQACVERNVDALIVHHGIFWEKNPYPIVGVKKEKIELLLKNEISLFSYHLPLDAHPIVGNNWRAAKEMSWENLQPFGEYEGNFIGVKGTFPEKPIETFIQEIEGYYGHKAFQALGGKKNVSSAALISGGAYRELKTAAKAEVDCFITGNFDEPAWNVAHEEKINFFACGHTATEKIGPKALAEYLKKHLGLDSFFIDTSNPF